MTKPKDYSESAVNLCNPIEVKALLDTLHDAQLKLEELEGQRQAELEMEIGKVNKSIADLQANIREAIEKHGSYQDTEAEVYGVKYSRKSKVYHTEPFKEHYPKFVPSVVVETISSKALDGLIKGGLIPEADLRMHKVITEDVGYAFYVR